jgi:hypothetical protein
MENTMQFTKLTHESIFGNYRCSPAVHCQPPPSTKPYVWYRGAAFASFRLRIGSGMTKISHIKYSVTTLLSHVCMLLMGTTKGRQGSRRLQKMMCAGCSCLLVA